jgi:RHS repeat-associated protein
MNQPLNVKPTPPNTTYTHDVDNRLLTAGSITFGYDSNGNLITKTLGGNVTNYTWDFNDMLTQVTANGNTYVYRYDALGNRVAKIANSVETRYVGDLAETDSSGNITAYYVYGLGLISKITPADESYFYHFDGLGSTIAITDVSGNVLNKYSYDEYGKVLSQEEAISNPFKYVGQFGVMDEGNGLLYMRARFYDPEVGRFISKDPIRFAGGDLNLYAYVANNPVIGVDPSGTIFWPGAAVGAIVGGAGGLVGALAQGGSFGDVLASTLIGAGTGAISGAFPLSIFGRALGGFILGGVANFVGQRIANPCGETNWSSVIGSAIGGAVGAKAGGVLSIVARNSFERAMMISWPSFTPSVGLGLVGTEIGKATGF